MPVQFRRPRAHIFEKDVPAVQRAIANWLCMLFGIHCTAFTFAKGRRNYVALPGEHPVRRDTHFSIRDMCANPQWIFERFFTDGPYFLNMGMVNASRRLGELGSVVMKHIGW